MVRMFRRWLVALPLFLSALAFALPASADVREIKYATAAPKESAWGKVFGAWAKAVEEESGGNLKLTWFYNGSKGDEIAMVGKMQSKELDGAAITGSGLAKIWPHVNALQLPGLFPNWAKLDQVRDKVSPKWDKEFAQQGYVVLGKGDVGIARLMSRGVAVRVPDDLKKGHPFFITGDTLGQKSLELAGVASPPSLSINAILAAVSSRQPGAIDIIDAPPIAAEQLGWAPQMDTINTLPMGIGIGALVMFKESYDGLPADARAILDRTGKNTGKLLTDRIRAIDDAAFNRLKSNKTVIDPSDAEKAAWNTLFAKVRQAIKAEGRIRADIMDEVVAAAGQ